MIMNVHQIPTYYWYYNIYYAQHLYQFTIAWQHFLSLCLNIFTSQNIQNCQKI